MLSFNIKSQTICTKPQALV